VIINCPWLHNRW